MVFVKGQSGNPGGRAKKDWTFAMLLEQVADETEEKTGKQYKELVARRLFEEAIKGNMGAIKEIMNRMDGVPRQSAEIIIPFETPQLSVGWLEAIDRIYGEQKDDKARPPVVTN